jgi:hypothetical protein
MTQLFTGNGDEAANSSLKSSDFGHACLRQASPTPHCARQYTQYPPSGLLAFFGDGAARRKAGSEATEAGRQSHAGATPAVVYRAGIAIPLVTAY